MIGAGIDLKALRCIIQQGALSGVSRLKVGDLEIEFHQYLNSPVGHKQGVLFQAGQPGRRKKSDIATELVMKPMDDEDLQDFQEVQLMIDDPVAYENQMISNHLETSREKGHEGTKNIGPESSLLRGRERR